MTGVAAVWHNLCITYYDGYLAIIMVSSRRRRVSQRVIDNNKEDFVLNFCLVLENAVSHAIDEVLHLWPCLLTCLPHLRYAYVHEGCTCGANRSLAMPHSFRVDRQTVLNITILRVVH